MTLINEGSTAWLTVAFFDQTGAAAAPTSVIWKVLDLESGTVLQAETTIATPGTTTTIEILATVNDLVAAGHYETRVVHLTANYAGGRVHNSEYRYQVANLL